MYNQLTMPKLDFFLVNYLCNGLQCQYFRHFTIDVLSAIFSMYWMLKYVHSQTGQPLFRYIRTLIQCKTTLHTGKKTLSIFDEIHML